MKIKNEAVTEEQKLVHEFNVYYTNIVQNTSGRIPSKVGAINQSLTDIEIVNRMIDSYKKHPSMKLIEENLSQKDSFHFANASARDVNRIIWNINLNKAVSLDKIPPKFVKLSANVIDAHLTYIFNRNISLNIFFSLAKIASVRHLKKKLNNYRPVSILNK